MKHKALREIVAECAADTQKMAAELAKRILASGPRRQSTVLALSGELGAGKTTFLQGFARGLGITETVNSPTFTIMKKFEIPNSRFQYFYHIDCYRLEQPEDILHLGFLEIISHPDHIVAIEWSERIAELLPKNVLWISLQHDGLGNRRTITIRA